MGKIILTGDRPTGRLHIGHYVGSLRRRVELQNSGKFEKIYIMIADAQALTDNFSNPEKVRSNIVEVALDYMACGIDPAKSTIFIQSQIPQLGELTFYYLNLVTLARLERNPTVKNEITMRDFDASIPAGFLCRQRTSPPSWRTPCPWVKTSSPCWNRPARLCAASTISMARHWWSLPPYCPITPPVCACPAPTAARR